jgi:LuxR family maltose regulon positive regulatory protein
MYEEDHVLMIATPSSALHTLTHKEFAIASDFAQGKSYKEVARTHGLPPETVRSRLRSVYEKLSVSDKAELSRRFTRTELLENLQELF